MRKKRGGRRVREAEERRLLEANFRRDDDDNLNARDATRRGGESAPKEPSSTVNSENILRQKPSSSLSTSHLDC